MIDTYVISLERARIRRQHIQKHFRSFLRKYEIVNAIDAQDFEVEQIKSLVAQDRRDWTNYLRPGAVCCALSHMRAYETFLSTDAEHCLVLEDDAELAISRKEYEHILERLINIDVDVIVFASFSIKKVVLQQHTVVSKNFQLFIANADDAPGGAVAYLIKREAARKILKYNNPVRDTADAWQSYIDNIGLKVLFLKPHIFRQANLGSTIDYVDRNSLLKRISPNWLRALKRAYLNHKIKNNVKLSRRIKRIT